MTLEKRCSTCGETRPHEDFSSARGRRPDGKQPRCKLCWAQWYEQRREQHIEEVTERYRRKRARVLPLMAAYLAEHPCVDCGESDVRCLDFDHVRGEKSRNISAMLSRAVAWEKVLVEIAKCDVRCANCHRRQTTQRGGHWRQAVYEQLSAEARTGGLARLGRVLPG